MIGPDKRRRVPSTKLLVFGGFSTLLLLLALKHHALAGATLLVLVLVYLRGAWSLRAKLRRVDLIVGGASSIFLFAVGILLLLRSL
ncbi:MAG: hypothetical protein AAFQ65_06420 [Myxococcota bacterium]